MNFQDIKLTKEPVMSFIPTDIRHTLVQFLKQEQLKNVTYQTILWRKIENDDTLRNRYRPYQEKAQLAFKQYGCDKDVRMFDGFISNIDPAYLFEKLKAFYGTNMDPDVIALHNSQTKPVAENKTSESVVLPLNDPRIHTIGGFEELQELQALMERKQLSQDDIILILNTLRWYGI